eukprot:TRINITY_DN3059_c0_g1_i1.p1 TRINITY_DN3059_c0_g1~~TRINITY_DN3059_c0_g1_i1.p1  ORF type:complete len:114 (+),score=17.95 TRINITY_DN3059_c0_g1_i1:116-457(+)
MKTVIKAVGVRRTASGFDKDFDRVVGVNWVVGEKPTTTQRAALAHWRGISQEAVRPVRSTVFKRTESGFDRDFDRIVCSGMSRGSGVNMPNACVFDPRWSKIIARHEAIQKAS